MKKWTCFILVGVFAIGGCSSKKTEDISSVSSAPMTSSDSSEEAVAVEPQQAVLLESTYQVEKAQEEVSLNSVTSFTSLKGEEQPEQRNVVTQEKEKQKTKMSESSSLVIQNIDKDIVYFDERSLSTDKVHSTGLYSYDMESGEKKEIKSFSDKNYIVSTVLNIGDDQAIIGYRSDQEGNQKLTYQTSNELVEQELVVGNETVKELISYEVTPNHAIFFVKTLENGEKDKEKMKARLVEYNTESKEFSLVEKPTDISDSVYYDEDSISYEVSDDGKTFALLVTQSAQSYLYVKEFGEGKWFEYLLEGEAKLTNVFYGNRLFYQLPLAEGEVTGSNYMVINIKTGNKRAVENVGELNLATSQRIDEATYATFGVNKLEIQHYTEEGLVNSSLMMDGELNTSDYTVQRLFPDREGSGFYVVASPVLKQKGDLSADVIYHVDKKEVEEE